MTSSKDEGKFKAQHKYEDKMRSVGMKQIRVWVPSKEEHRLRSFAAELREPHLKNFI